MSQDRWIDIETAKKLLKKVCDFLEIDESGVADFKITNGKEAVLMSMYSEAFFILNEKYKLEFGPISFDSREPKPLILPHDAFRWSSAENIPVFPESLSTYFKIFPDLAKPKYLFMVNLKEYVRPKDERSATPYYELHAKEIVQDILEKIKTNNISPTDCLVWVSTSDGTYGEDFWEYIAGVVLRKKGYLVTYYGLGGLADLFAYYIPDYLEKLIKNNLLCGGAFLEELEVLGISNGTKSKFIPSKKRLELIVIEAESTDIRTRSHSEKVGVGQALRYVNEVGYTGAFVAGPFTKETDILENCRDKVGLISCDNNGNLIFYEPKGYAEPPEYKVEIAKNLIKCSLLRNLSFEERCKLIGISPTNLNDYFDKILSLDIDQILEKIKEKLKI